MSVDIEVARRAGVVVVPTDAVHDATGTQPWVLVVGGHRAVRQPVKIGLRGDDHVEVVEGVAPGRRARFRDECSDQGGTARARSAGAAQADGRP